MSRSHPFDRSGFAALNDLTTPEWQAAFALLEKDQEEFLGHEAVIFSPGYPWPHDSLHEWSRRWEYPYVHHQLSRKARDGERLRLADVGCGVTFFPFSMSRLGYLVSCTDTDPVCGVDLPRASEFMDPGPGQVEFRLAQAERLPFRNDEVDVVTCVSVLEHIPDFERTVAEMARILKPSGLLVLTIDLDLGGNSEIGAQRYRHLLDELLCPFEWAQPDQSVHPADQLTSWNGPVRLAGDGRRAGLRFRVRQAMRALLGLPVRTIGDPYHLAVQGLTMRKRLAPSGSVGSE